MKLFLSILLVSFLISDICAQKGAQKAELLAYNVIFSGVTSGIGSMIHAPKNVKKGKAFLTDFLSKYPLFLKRDSICFHLKKSPHLLSFQIICVGK
ncbi:MAG: hypothetical protein IM563_08975 [Chitinophagaceae bacterium]|jgi:hypothetical protein|nr:hypothetical protein [Chitinophagaceae bacterium]